MPEEINEGIAYLRALRQSAGHAGGAAAIPARESPISSQEDPVQPEDQFKGAKKRRSIRYKCEGSAQLREEGVDIHTWVSFSDVSMHGCYVEAQATSPAGTALHMKTRSQWDSGRDQR